jgi:membrane-bound lytic murein transglycosylase B
MDRRAFLIMALAGAADSGSGTGTPPAPLSAAAPPEPAAQSGDTAFQTWAAGFIGEAILAGLPAEVVTREMTGLTPDPRIDRLDSGQPEFAKPISSYIKGVVSDDRIALGRRKCEGLGALPRIEATYGVPRSVLVSIWAVETAFGQIQGDFDVVRSLATLAASGRRRDWAETQLIAAIRIIADGEASRAQLKGSWAGAMGQTQFEPDTYLTTAVDGDGDGRRDIWNSSADALASAANLLAKAGWIRGQAWEREVSLPSGFDYSLSEGPRQGPAAWAALGVRTADGAGWSSADAAGQAQLLLPTGAARRRLAARGRPVAGRPHRGPDRPDPARLQPGRRRRGGRGGNPRRAQGLAEGQRPARRRLPVAGHDRAPAGPGGRAAGAELALG